MLLSSDDETWQRLLPNVWETVIDDPPAKLGVRIADSPGDAEERERLRMSISSQLCIPEKPDDLQGQRMRLRSLQTAGSDVACLAACCLSS